MSAWKLLCCVAGLLVLVGCGSTAATVSGKVTLDGQPLSKGNIAFYAAGNAALATGTIDSSGNFTLNTGTDKGLTPGNYNVTIVANDVIEPSSALASPIPKLITPAKYSNVTTSGLTAEVKPGSNHFNFDLVSKP